MHRICSNTDGSKPVFFLRGDLWHTCQFDIQDDGEARKSIREWEIARNVTDGKKAAISHYGLF